MFIDFEGIDGSGKTSLSNLLLERLRRSGYRVCHAREGGTLKSPVARRVRELTRDARLFAMCPEAELFLNLARDAQQLAEVIRPALARGEICITDRYLYSQLALSGAGRGLSPQALAPAVELAAQGIWPDLVVLVDVEPELARLRKRVGKLLEGREEEEGSRKGLAGAGLQVRIRDHFLELARAEPSRWVVLENHGERLPVLADRVAELVIGRLEGRDVATGIPPGSAARAEEAVPLDRLLDRFLAAVDDLAEREPALAAHLLAGIPGDEVHARRVKLAPVAPQMVARSLKGLFDTVSWDLRHALADVAPAEVVHSLGCDASPRAMALREGLFGAARAAVLRSLAGNGSEGAWELRERGLDVGALGEVLSGLGRVDDVLAWRLRENGADRRLWREVAQSLGGVAGGRADEVRATLLGEDPLAAVRSTSGVESPVARRIREAMFHRAPKKVLRSLTGIDAPYAWELRERAVGSTKEALDSVDGMEVEPAWSLRERHWTRWPSTALSSLEHLGASERGRALVEQVLRACPGRLAVLRNACAAVTRVNRVLPDAGAAPRRPTTAGSEGVPQARAAQVEAAI